MQALTKIGAVAALFGFGSVVLFFLDYHFSLLAWADDMQPWFGFVLGAVGAVLIAVGTTRGQKPAPDAVPPAQTYAPQAYPSGQPSTDR